MTKGTRYRVKVWDHGRWQTVCATTNYATAVQRAHEWEETAGFGMARITFGPMPGPQEPIKTEAAEEVPF